MLDTMTKLMLKGVKTNHFGHEVLYTQLPFATVEAIFEIDYEVQRQLDPNRRIEIRRFILDAIANGMPLYFSPFVYSARNQIEQHGEDFVLIPGSKLYIIDAQHRSVALSSAITYLNSELEILERFGQHDEIQKIKSYIHSLRTYPITLQIYLNLTQQQERQLFTDINSTSREAHSGLQLKFDQRDSYNMLTRKVAQQLENQLDIEMNASRLNAYSASITTLTTMKKCILVLFEGVTASKREHWMELSDEPQLIQIATAFFENWLHLFPSKMYDRKKYACGLAGVQIALAQTVYSLTRKLDISYEEAIEKLLLLNKQCTWLTTDSLFAHMYNEQKNVIERHSSYSMVKATTLKMLEIIMEGEQ